MKVTITGKCGHRWTLTREYEGTRTDMFSVFSHPCPICAAKKGAK
jgi:hypothetical protein